MELQFLKLRNFSINIALQNLSDDEKKPNLYGLQLNLNNIEYFKDNVIPSLGELNLMSNPLKQLTNNFLPNLTKM